MKNEGKSILLSIHNTFIKARDSVLRVVTCAVAGPGPGSGSGPGLGLGCDVWSVEWSQLESVNTER